MVAASPSCAPALTFEILVSQANRTRGTTRGHALDLGLDEQALARYVSGACSAYERTEIERSLLQCNWAMERVVEMMRSRRRREAA